MILMTFEARLRPVLAACLATGAMISWDPATVVSLLSTALWLARGRGGGAFRFSLSRFWRVSSASFICENCDISLVRLMGSETPHWSTMKGWFNAWVAVHRCEGSSTSRCLMKSFAFSDTLSHHGRSNWYLPAMIFLKSSVLFWSKKGGYPHSRMYVMTPSDHMSTCWPYPWRLSTSGATYPGVPHAVRISCTSSKILDSPKSLIFTDGFFPLRSDSRRFSGCVRNNTPSGRGALFPSRAGIQWRPGSGAQSWLHRAR